MKIRDIVTESDAGDIANLSANNVSKGYDAVNKLFTPSEWFKGKEVDVPDEPDEPAAAKSKVSNTGHLEKQALAHASSGSTLYPEDIQHLKAIHAKVVNNKVRTEVDPTQLADTIKMAYQSRPLTDEQKSMLLNFSKEL
jgi:hypothetical protein